MTIQAKICGLTDEEAAAAAVDGVAAFIGFVFFPKSPRNISPAAAHLLANNTPADVRKVAVTVDATDDELKRILEGFRPDYWQFHGRESPRRVRQVHEAHGIPVIKAITVRNAGDVAGALAYRDSASMLLFDARAPEPDNLPGGNGLSFDWNLLSKREFPLPWFLSGGLNANNVAKAVEISGARMVDVSSSVESAPGKKDPVLIRAFLEAVKAI